MECYIVWKDQGYGVRVYGGHKRFVVRRTDGCKGIDVDKGTNDVLVVKVMGDHMKQANDYAAMALDGAMSSPDLDMQAESPLESHSRSLIRRMTQVSAW